MKIDRIIYPITSLGPGNRVAIWTVGCSKRCFNCASRELWNSNAGNDIDVNILLDAIKEQFSSQSVDGFTITGGDPLEQGEELLILLRGLKRISDDILVYTGYEFNQLADVYSEEFVDELSSLASVIIDGRYIDELNDNQSCLIGSTNQNIIFLDGKMVDKYNEYIAKGRTIQNVYYRNSLMSVGIHNK